MVDIKYTEFQYQNLLILAKSNKTFSYIFINLKRILFINKSKVKSKTNLIITLFILLGVLTRLIPHADNFTAVYAIALF